MVNANALISLSLYTLPIPYFGAVQSLDIYLVQNFFFLQKGFESTLETSPLTKIWKSLSDMMFDFLTKPLSYDHWSKHSCCYCCCLQTVFLPPSSIYQEDNWSVSILFQKGSIEQKGMPAMLGSIHCYVCILDGKNRAKA